MGLSYRPARVGESSEIPASRIHRVQPQSSACPFGIGSSQLQCTGMKSSSKCEQRSLLVHQELNKCFMMQGKQVHRNLCRSISHS